MDAVDELSELESYVNEWMRRALALAEDMRLVGVGVSVSATIRSRDETLPPRAEITIRISPVGT